MKRVRRLPAATDGGGWVSTLPQPPPARPLGQDVTVEAAIVGAGYTGLAVSRRLGQLRPDWRIVLLDAGRVGNGASGQNVGKLGPPGTHAPPLLDRELRRLVRLGGAGQSQLANLVGTLGIDCGWSPSPRVVSAASEATAAALQKTLTRLERAGVRFEQVPENEVGELTGIAGVANAFVARDTVLFHPLALVRGLAAALPANVSLHEQTPVLGVRRDGGLGLETPRAWVRTEHLFLATNGFLDELTPGRRRVVPRLAFASLSRPLAGAQLKRLGTATTWASCTRDDSLLRVPGNRLLVRSGGGGRPHALPNRTGREAAEAKHRSRLQAAFPDLDVEIEATWSGVIGKTRGSAFLFACLAPDIFAAGGYNGTGVALSTVAGTLLAELACGERSELLSEISQLPSSRWLPPGEELLWALHRRIAGAS